MGKSRLPRGLLGKKMASSHTTALDGVGRLAQRLDSDPDVVKMVLGRIKSGGSGHIRAKIKDLPSPPGKTSSAGLSVAVTCDGGTQDLIVYTSKPDQVRERIEKMFDTK